jgi:hypothetical protein
MTSQREVGRGKESLSRYQMLLLSLKSLILILASETWSGPTRSFRRGPAPVQLSFQKFIFWPFRTIQPFPRHGYATSYIIYMPYP